MTEFHVRNQRAHTISMVGGNQYNNTDPAALDPRAELRLLVEELTRVQLPPYVAHTAHHELAVIDDQLAAGHSADLPTRLSRLTALLTSAGALASGGSALATHLSNLTGWVTGG
ncbi:hypothetical protein ACIBUY_08740 [Streptomyces sp. NPDC050085]|uniref:hypothetical protein n=1 Tax=Streptomyces sp. NPDC050085 TaxID=3365600 RepID=UPI003795E1BC